MAESNNSSENITKLLEQFKHINSIISKCEPLVKEIQERDIVILLGNSKAGNSTLCHYLIGNELTGITGRKFGNFRIFKLASNSLEGPIIGENSYSETTLPTVWKSRKIPEIVVDAPGFDNNESEAQDIANCFYIKNMILNSECVKFVLVSDVNDIMSDSINSFITFVDKVHTVLPNLRDVLQGVCLVFTKVVEDISSTDIRKRLEEISRESKICIEESVLRCFIDHSNIAIFRAPNEEGPVTPDISMNVINTINNLKAIPRAYLLEMGSVLSDKSRTFLLSAEREFTENPAMFEILKSIPEDLEERFGGVFDTETAEKVKLELLQLQELVEEIKISVKNKESFVKILDDLMQLCSSNLQQQKATEDLKTILQFVDFIGDIFDRSGNTLLRMYFDTLVHNIDITIQSSLTNAMETLKISEEEVEAKKQRIQKLKVSLETKTRCYEDRINNLMAELNSLKEIEYRREAKRTSDNNRFMHDIPNVCNLL